ncbi:unnamed protein product [Ixodes pacificus]
MQTRLERNRQSRKEIGSSKSRFLFLRVSCHSRVSSSGLLRPLLLCPMK